MFAPPKPKPASTKLPQVLSPQHPFGPELILIPAGKFLMGSDPKRDKQARDNEQPQHSLYLPDYYIAKTPVTNAQYAAFVRAIGLRPPEQWNWKRKEPPQGEENHPVVDVSWQDAVAHCRWLAKTTGKPYRLPTEAEWEKAARGTDSRIYPWGNLWAAKQCNTAKGGKNHTTSVGSYPGGASPYGVLDMAGNVREWVADWYDEKYYSNSPAENPPGPPKGDYKVLRGGSWYFFADYARASNRCGSNPADQSGDIGFRCVVSAP